MGFLKKLSASPAALFACLVAGGLVGHFFPEFGSYASVAGQLYLGVVGMAALPLLVVATFFGLRQILTLPQPAKRVLMIVAFALLLVSCCAFAGMLVGALTEPGRNLDHSTREYLGALVQRAGSSAGDTEITLGGELEPRGQEIAHWSSGFFPDNFFRVLADGQSLGILICAILFGLAFAALSKTRNLALTGVFEAIYRALEFIISRVNMFIPVLVFSMAAFFTAETEPRTIAAMGSFLGWFLLLTTVLSGGAIALIRKQCSLPVREVLSALKAPALISLTSASTTASIPDTIDAMSNRLGFSRGIVELVTPISSVFLRSGSAVYFALVTVFVANLYGRSLGPQELMLVVAGASLAAFASAGHNSFANAGYAGLALAMLQLPAEAALALFLAIDVLCEGPRNLLTLLVSCALIALVSRGLPSERLAASQGAPTASTLRPVRFAFTRADLVVGMGCCLLVAVLLVMLGIGVGLKRGAQVAPAAVILGFDNVGFLKKP